MTSLAQRTLYFCAALLLGLTLTAAPHAQPFDLPADAVGAGTTHASGGSFTLRGTVGQTATGQGVGGAYIVSEGFWPTVAASTPSGPALSVTITPTNPTPPVVLQRGDFVFFDLTFAVGASGPSSFEFWTEAVLPNNSVRSPLLGPNTVNVTPPATVTLSFSQRVPNIAPFGSYTYRAEAGTFPGTVLDSDSFAAEITPGREAGPAAWQAFDSDGHRVDGPRTYDFRGGGETEETPRAASETALPDAVRLNEAYPNPFRRSATVPFDLPETQRLQLTVYDVLGREVAVLLDGEAEAGSHEAVLDGSRLPSGVYLVRLVAGDVVQTQRLTRVR